MARSRRTTTVSRCSCGAYSASASAGRGTTHSRPSPTAGWLTMCGPTATGLAARFVSGLPTGAGTGGVVSGTATRGSGRPNPPLGPRPRWVPPYGGSSGGRGVSGGMIVISVWCRSMRHDAVTATAMSATCTAALAAHVSRRPARGNTRSLNSGEHLSQALRGLDQPRRADGERDAEETFPTSTEAAPRKHDHAGLFERALLERGRRHPPLGERHPDVHRGPRCLRLEPLRAEHGEHGVAPLLEARHVALRERLRLRQHRGARRLHREKRAGIHVVLDARQRGDHLGPPHRPAEPPPRHAERLRERMELDRDVARARDLEDARRHVPVERDLAVRVVVGDDDAALAAERDRALEDRKST